MIILCVCVRLQCACAKACMWRLEENSGELILSFHLYMGSGESNSDNQACRASSFTCWAISPLIGTVQCHCCSGEEMEFIFKKTIKGWPWIPRWQISEFRGNKTKGGWGFENNTITRTLLVSVCLLLGSTTHNPYKGGDFSTKQWNIVRYGLVWWGTPVIVTLRKWRQADLCSRPASTIQLAGDQPGLYNVLSKQNNPRLWKEKKAGQSK